MPDSKSIPEPTTAARFAAEVAGTFLLVFGSIGTVLFTANFAGGPNGTADWLAGGLVGVALAFGLSLLVGVYAFGPISGGHFNPAVTVGQAAAGRFPWRDAWWYIAAQVIGGLIATAILAAILAGSPAGFTNAAFAGASNGYDAASPGGFSLASVAIVEVVLTATFVAVILAVTHERAASGFAGIAIGLALTLIHLASIPVSNTSVNPARSIATAVFGGAEPIGQLWLFIIAPIVGGLIAGYAFGPLFGGSRGRQ
jgi:aquaporin Z